MVNFDDIDFFENKLTSIVNALAHCENDLRSVWNCEETKYVEYAIDSIRREIERLRSDAKNLQISLWM